MNWLYYIAEANLYLIIFYAGYCLFLNKETHYTLNRIYLLSSCVLALVLPMLQLGFLKPHILSPAETIDPNLYPDGPELWQQNLIGIYVLGACLSAILFLFKLFKLWVIIRESYISKTEKHKLIHIDERNTAFSFFNYLFIAEDTQGIDFITHHELVHIRQKHSIDIIFTEMLKVIGWFNPVIYLLQRSLKNVHEFIADEKTATINNDRLGYSAFLVNNAYGLGGSSITHSFFNNNLLKRRILMLNSERSGKLSTCKYLLIFPLFAGMLCVSTLSFSKSYGWFDVAPMQQQVPPPPPPQPPKPIKAAPPAPHAKSQYVMVNGKRRLIHINPNAPKPHSVPEPPKLKKVVKFPPPLIKPSKPPKAVTKRPPPPPPAPPISENAASAAPKAAEVVHFPKPVVKPPKAKAVKFPPPVVKPNEKKVVKFPPPVVKSNDPSN